MSFRFISCFTPNSELPNSELLVTNVLRQKSLYFHCHSGLDPESSVFTLDSRWSLPRT